MKVKFFKCINMIELEKIVNNFCKGKNIHSIQYCPINDLKNGTVFKCEERAMIVYSELI